MPQNPLLWLAGIFLVAAIVALAIWASDKVDFSASGKGLRLKTERKDRAGAATKVSVAEGAIVEGKIEEGIVGVSGTPPDSLAGIDVARKATLRNDVGKIVGWEVAPPPDRKK